MAAAADRLVGDALEPVSPELALVDAALCEEERLRLDVPDDTLARIGRMRIERPALRLAEDPIDANLAEPDHAPEDVGAVVVHTLEAAHHEVGIEDLIVIPADDETQRMPLARLVVPDHTVAVPDLDEVARPEPAPADVAPMPASDIDDLLVVPDARTTNSERASRTYPSLPSPPADTLDVDATDAVLRQIRDHLEPDAPARRRRRRRRLLSFVSVSCALCAAAIYAVDVQLGLLQLPGWLPS